jgi:glutaryl-CoA dehydrogenase
LELALRDRVRAFVDERIRLHVGERYEAAHFPLELVKELGNLGAMAITLSKPRLSFSS